MGSLGRYHLFSEFTEFAIPHHPLADSGGKRPHLPRARARPLDPGLFALVALTVRKHDALEDDHQLGVCVVPCAVHFASTHMSCAA